MNKVLVTGKTGTVGSNLDIGWGLSSKLVDLRIESEVEELVETYQPDAIVHLAAKVGGLKLHLKEKYKLFFDNIKININTIHAAQRYNVPRVLSFLSSCVFSDGSTPPYTEDMVHDFEPFKVHYPYGHAKRILEVHSRICYEQYGLKYNCVIPTNIYGINDDFNFDTGHVVGVLIHKAYLAQKNNCPFIIWGDGKQKRDFIFTDDITKLTKWALENYLGKEPLIFSNSTPIEIGYIAELIAEEFDIKNKIVFDTNGPSGQKERSLSGEKLKSLIDFKFTPIEEGIKKSCAWFIKNYPNVRL